ncbi:MAG: ATP-binding protein [Sandaracinaceae bacterium]|nr:ATP-binding protein [Sandaracinaceae bacterium]
MERYLAPAVEEDLARKMVFLGGARQVGKTTLAKRFLDGGAGYLTWDAAEDRERILRRELPAAGLWVFDELHKYRGWRGYLKGLYDKRTPGQRILITGSARLDLYRHGGDSLQGRYHYLRLHPLSAAELGMRSSADLETMMRLGPFPEPFLSGSARLARRWSREHRTRLVREDVRDLERIVELDKLELLALRLPELVGSPLSINALREDLQVAFKSAERWVAILERLYAVFRVPPFGAPKLRAVKKAQKHYHLDYSPVPDDAARFENLVAAHLLKWVHREQDLEGRDLELRYFRDIDGREVDFVVVERRKPILFVECKLTSGPLDPGLRYLVERFPRVPAWQVALRGERDAKTPEGVRLAPALALLSTLA